MSAKLTYLNSLALAMQIVLSHFSESKFAVVVQHMTPAFDQKGKDLHKG